MVTLSPVADHAVGGALPTKIDPAEVNEGESVNHRFSLTFQPATDITVSFTGYEGTDLSMDKTQLTFTPSNWNILQTVKLTAGEDDDKTEDVITLTLTVSRGGLTSSEFWKVTIIDDDQLPLWMWPSMRTFEGAGSGRFPVGLPSKPSGDVTVTISGHLDTDLTLDRTKLTFTPSSWNFKWVNFTVAEDADDNDEFVTLTASAVGGEWEPASMKIRIYDEDQSTNVGEGGTTEVFTALNSPIPLTSDAIVVITGFEGTDLTLEKDTVFFTPLNYFMPQSVKVTAAEDHDFADEAILLRFDGYGGLPRGFPAWKPDYETVVIFDNDSASLIAPDQVTVAEGGENTFGVALASSPPAGDVTVSITGHTGTDLTPDLTSLTFTASNWNKEQTVRLMAGRDNDLSDDAIYLTLSASGGGYKATHVVQVTVVDNTIPHLIALASETLDEGTSKSFDVSLSVQPIGDTKVAITGHANTDLRLSPSVLTFTPTNWSTATVTLTAGADLDDTDDQVTLTLTASGGRYTGVTHTAVVTITDNNVASVTAPASVTVTEGGTSNLPVVLAARPTGHVTITIIGHADTDLIPTPPTLTFTTTDWNTSQMVKLTAKDDHDFMNDLVALTLTASGGGYAGLKHSVAVTITDDDVPAVTAPVSLTVPEGSSSNLPVVLSAQPTAEVTLKVTGHAATDLTPTPLVLIFTPTDWATARTVTVTAAEDGDVMNDQVALTFTALGGSYTGVTHSVAVTITDNDVASVMAPTSAVVPEGGMTDLSVALSAQPTAEVTLTITGHVATDLMPAPTTLIFTPANWATAQTVTLAAAEDGDFTQDEVMLTLTASGGGYANVTHPVAVTITDNDVAAVTAPASVVLPEGRSTNLSVSLSSSPTVDVTLTFQGHAGTDLTPTPPVLVFTPADWSVPQTVTLTAIEDGDFTDDQIALTLTATGGGYTGVTHSVAVTITDNDVAAVTAPASVVVSEGSSSDLSVALSAQPTAEVTLTVSGHASTDLTPTPPVLVFTSTDWATAQILTLAASEDGDFTDDWVALMLTASGGGYTGVTHSVAVTITDNDEAAVAAPMSVVVSEGSSSDLSVALSAQPTAEVTLTVSGHAGTDLTPTPQTLTFTTTSWSTSQTVTLTAGEDEDFTDDQVALMLTASGGGYTGVTHSVAVTITDNDTEAPLALSIHDLQILEDAARAWLRIELNRPSDQVVTVQYATSDRTAEGGLDYTASRGIVVFDRNTTKGVIPVAIMDDELPEEQEQLAVTLSKPRNAVIARGVGTLTILDNDGGVTLRIEDEVVEENAEVIRFTVQLSRPSSESVTVAYRTEDGTAKAGKDYRASSGIMEFAPGMVAVTIAVPLLRENLDWREETFSVHLERSTHARIEKAVAVATIRNTDSVARDMLAAYTARFVRTSSMQIVEALQERVRSHADGSACGAGARAELARLWHAPTDWTPSLGELLAGCRISEKMEASGGAVRAWGRGAFRRFNGQGEGALTLHGEVTTGIVGIDYGWNGRWVAGVLLTHSRGEGTFSVRHDSGDMQSRLTGMYPYVAYQSGTGGIWGTGGYGRGQVDVSELEGGLGTGFGALGFWGRLRSGHSVGVTYYGDGIYADAAIQSHDVRVDVYRLRLGLEANLRIRERVRPYVKAHVRQDGGSAETGLGLELGAGVRVAVPTWRLKADVQTQRLVVHTVDGFTEWGVSGSVQVGNGTDGLMLRVRPSWGLNQGMSLSRQQTILEAVPTGGSLGRTEMELGYGVPIRRGTARSILSMTRLSKGVIYRLGGEIHPRDRFTLSVFGLAHAHGAAPGELGLNVRGLLKY